MYIGHLKRLLAILLFSLMLAGGISVHAAEETQPTETEYQTQYEDAIKLADMLRTSPYLLHNKLYTAEQEVELQALVDSVCDGSQSDRDKADALLACIADRLEPGECYELNGWDTLCDGDTEMTIKGAYGDETYVPKKQVEQEVYCFTFYDVCRLANIPCFILEDCRGEYNELNNKYICMVYIENASGTGKEWHFVDVMAEDGRLISAEEVYEVMGDNIFPMNILFDYDKIINAMNVIFLNKETMLTYSGKSKITPYLAYDRDTGKVKAYFKDGTRADGEQYCRTETKVSEDGEVPTGWIETKSYSDSNMTTYLHYSLYGVFLRGRVKKDDTEYNMQADWNDKIPYHAEVGSEEESEEHKAYRVEYRKKLQDKAIAYAEAMLKDKKFIWNDTKFNEEDQALLEEAVETALDWDYITGDEWSVRAFENAGISLTEEEPDALSDKAKAEAILVYVKRNVEPLETGPWNENSAFVLRVGGATCVGMSLLYRDMCVMAGLPCFSLGCSVDMDIGDSLNGNHADNMVKVGDEWLFVDAMGSWIVGKGDGYQLTICEGYSTSMVTRVYLDCEATRKNIYYKWRGIYNEVDYYDFDSDGNLGIYRRNRLGEPIIFNSGFYKTDENGKYLQKNGLNTVDLTETSEDGTAQVVNRYAYYYQYGRVLQGDKLIDGKEYHFDMDVGSYSDCHKVEEISRRYYIYKLDFRPIEDQPYNKDGVCPIPEIYHGDKKLELGKDFKIVEYTHNKEVTSYVDASYKVEGIGDYLDEATRTFKIVKADISDVEVTLSETSYTWTPGQSYYRPDVNLDLDWQDYSVAYYDYNKPGQARVVITGKRNYTGSITKYYDINPRVWNDKEFKILDRNKELLQSQEFSYNFYPVTPEAKVYWFDEEGTAQSLSEGSDYDISYSNSDKPGTVTVTATAKGNYQGSVTCTYKIKEYDIGNNSGISRLMSRSQDSLKVRYTGSPVMPGIPDFGDLEEGVHYTMTVTDNVNAGIAKITLQGIGVCTGTYEKKFEVIPYALSENAINVEYRYTTYNGKVQKPSVTIKADLVEGRDYFISYEKEVDGEYQETEPKEVGEYRIAIRVTDNVFVNQVGGADTDEPDGFYFSYSIKDDGSGNSNTGSDTGNESGNIDPGTGNETGNSGSGTGNSETGRETGDNQSAIEKPDTGNGTSNQNSVTGVGTSDSVSKVDTNSVSAKTEENATSNATYSIKKLKLTSMKKAIKLSWTKIKKAEGYQIQFSLYKNFKKTKTINVKKSKKSYTLKKLKKNKKYYVRIRAYCGKGKKRVFGKWRTSSKKTK